MGTVNNAITLLKKRPSILVLTIIISSAICIFENVLMTLFYGITMFKTDSPFDAYINILQFIIKAMLVPQTTVKIICVLAILVIFIALVLALLLSGYFNILNDAVLSKDNHSKSGFVAGIKKYFFRILSLNLWTLCLGILFVIYVLIASIPAAIFIDNAFNGEINVIAGILLFIITTLVIFFTYAFFRQYILFWYPSALVYDKNHFIKAKKISDGFFWTLLSKFVIFDIVLVTFDVLYVIASFSLANSQVVSSSTNIMLLIVNIVFKTIFIALAVCFVFASFKSCNDKYRLKTNKNS